MSQILFLITPIIWLPSMLEQRSYLAEANPFYHLIEVVRAPLLGSAPSANTVAAVVAITAVNFLLTTVLFSRYRSRIAYWI
jgi:ABC-2 type transport system permease protein/lipopolysaccharide transport system permease protein